MKTRSIFRRRLIGLASAAALLTALPGLLSGTVEAQDFPKKQPITIVVSYAAGGPSDLIARLVGDHMGRTLGQTVLIENVTGAGGLAGADRVSRAAPDGYMMLIHHLALPAGPSLYTNLRYDTATAFQPVGLVNTGPMLLITRKDLPAATSAEFFAWMKANGEKVTVGHAGVGSNAYICATLVSAALGVKPTLVAYRGAAPALNDILGGKLDVLCDQTTNSVPQVQAGTVKAFVTTAPTRVDVVKDVPTVREAGIPSAELGVWHGLYVPKGTPKPIVDALNAALQKALTEPAVIEKFTQLGTTIYPLVEQTPEAHQTRFQGEIKRLADLLRGAGVTPAETK